MAVKKTTSKKTISSSRRKKKSVSEQHKAAAAKNRKNLVAKLKKDLQATKKALRSAKVAASAELKLVKAAAKTEMDVLKDQLAAAIKREEALRKISQEKAKQMWKAGEQWEKQQLAKLKGALRKSGRGSRG